MKDKQFDKLIWDAYGQESDYDSLRYKLFRIKEIMSNHHKSFATLPTKQQFDYCITIGIIVVQSTTKDLRRFSLNKPKDEIFEYSIDEGFVPPVQIVLKNHKRLHR